VSGTEADAECTKLSQLRFNLIRLLADAQQSADVIEKRGSLLSRLRIKAFCLDLIKKLLGEGKVKASSQTFCGRLILVNFLFTSIGFQSIDE
jgi:hypothetical protein